MTPKHVLVIGAIAAAIFGLALTLAPVQMLAGFGLDAPDAAQILSRDVGATLIGLAVLNYLARNATGAALHGILFGNLAIQILEFVVNGVELLTGQLPSAAAGGEIIHVVLGALFAWALIRARATAA